MAAMRKADDTNLEKLKSVFPETLAELRARYNAPGGALNEQELAWVMRVIEDNAIIEQAAEDLEDVYAA
jgi:hypothetical protein